MLTVLLVVLALAVITMPTWRHSRNWGYYPSSGLGLVVVVLVLLRLSGRI